MVKVKVRHEYKVYVVWIVACFFEDGEEKVFFGGDILPEPEQLLRKFKAKYDFDPTRSMELRDHYGKLAAENNWLCLFYHAKSQATGRVQLKGDAFRIV